MEKRRWRARAPRPVGPSVARMQREASWSAERSSALAVKTENGGADGKAALARARSKTCRPLGGADATRSVLECGTQFRFGRQIQAFIQFAEFCLTPRVEFFVDSIVYCFSDGRGKVGRAVLCPPRRARSARPTSQD